MRLHRWTHKQYTNMEEEPKTEETTTSPKKRHSFRVWMRKFWYKVLEYSHLKDDTDYDATVKYISDSVEFRGVNLWVLAFAIIVASVGLNMNSTAVIIGAMLISPIMGPITGIGLAVGVLDEDLLKKSLRNFLIMVVISLVTSTLYFLVSPLSEAQSELLARIRPTIFDVLIAFFGGLAGIVATSRRTQPITIISGVAIATALMPPLCTAGYGLATWQLRFFGGAFYLFFINSFFIALATFIMVRFLGFPQQQYGNESRLNAVKKMIYIFAVIVMIPSLITAINLVRESSFNSQSIKFVHDIQQTPYFDNVQLIDSQKEYAKKEQTVTLRVIGKQLTPEDILQMQGIMQHDYGLSRAKLVVKQTEGVMDITQQTRLVEDLMEKKDSIINVQKSEILELQARLDKLTGSSENTKQIVKEIKTQHSGIQSVAIMEMQCYDASDLSATAIPVVYLKWKDGQAHPDAERRLLEWLQVRLNVEKLEMVRIE